jgi:hypothetical protein
MEFTPANFIAGPAIVTFDSQTFSTKNDISVKIARETFDINSSRHGLIDKRLKSYAIEISFQPVGQVENLTKYFPYDVSTIGSSIFSATDKPLVIQTLAGQAYTFARAAMIKMPTLKLSATDTMFGEMTFLCILKSATDFVTAGALLGIASSAFSNTTFDESKITTPGYTAAYGSAPYATMESLDGFTVEIGMDITRDYVDRFGIVGARLKSLSATAKFTPIGLTEAQWATLVALDGANVVIPGQSVAKSDTDLVITGGSSPAVSITLHKAGILNSGLAFGDAPRLQELEFVCKRTWSSGTADPLFTFTAT